MYPADLVSDGRPLDVFDLLWNDPMELNKQQLGYMVDIIVHVQSLVIDNTNNRKDRHRYTEYI